MPHVVTVPPPPLFTADGLRIDRLPAASDNLVWVLSDGGEAWVVDGPSAVEVVAHLAERQLRLAGVLITHGHGDHVGVVFDLHARGLLAGVELVAPAAATPELPCPPTQVVAEGSTVAVLGRTVRVWETPGHHPWHVSYVLGDDAVFCGDTLFAGGCGRAFHDVDALFGSLGRLRSLPAEVLVCCAHEYTLDNLRFGAWASPGSAPLRERLAAVEAARARGECRVPSTVGEERATNVFVRCHDPDGGGAEAFRTLRAQKDVAAHRAG